MLASCSKDGDSIEPNDKTGLVIGAGIPGLSSAKELKQKGFTIIVFKTQEKVGDRIRRDRSLGVAIDDVINAGLNHKMLAQFSTRFSHSS